MVHPNYDRTNFNNDIALIELEEPVSLDGVVKTVCLPDAGEYAKSKKKKKITLVHVNQEVEKKNFDYSQF